jgi:hypothetical protein
LRDIKKSSISGWSRPASGFAGDHRAHRSHGQQQAALHQIVKSPARRGAAVIKPSSLQAVGRTIAAIACIGCCSRIGARVHLRRN